MPFLPASETCFVVVALLALFLEKSVVVLSSGTPVFSFVLHLTSHHSVSIIVVPALSSHVGYVRLEIFLLVVLFLKPVVDACS